MVTKSPKPKTPKSRTAAPARDRARTEQAILDAIGRLILREGLPGVGINALAREAGADKVLIYRYFGDLDGVYKAFAERSDFWWTLDEILGTPRPDPRKTGFPELAKILFRRHAAAIRARPVTLAVIAAELEDRTALVVALEEVREQRALELEKWLDETYSQVDGVDLPAVTTLITAAIDYLAARARKIRIYGGVGIKGDAEWERLLAAVDQIIDGLFPTHRRKPQ